MNRSLLPYLSGAGAVLCWASMAAAIGRSLRSAAPETVVFWALLAAGLALAVLERAQGRRALRWPGWRGAVFGVCGIWGYHTLVVFAFARAPLLQANVLNFTWMVGVVLLGGLLARRRVTPRMLLAALVGVLGAVLAIGSGQPPGATPRLDLAFAPFAGGYGLALAAALVWSGYTVLTPVVAPTSRASLTVVFLLSAAAALALLLLRGAPLALPENAAQPVAILGVVSLALAFPLWAHAAHGAHGQVLGLLSLLTPLVSTLLAGWLLHLRVDGALLVGLALILVAAVLGGAGAPHPAPEGAP